MKNICFNLLHYKTLFLHPLAIELEKKGFNIFWISPSPFWREWLISQGIEKAKILDLSEATHVNLLSEESIVTEKEMLFNLEKKNTYTINNMILSDRLLREKPEDFRNIYILNLNYLIRKFLIENDINIVMGEPTPVNELLTTLICNELDIPYLFPFTVRIPGDRFTFFSGRNQTTICNSHSIEQENIDWAIKYLNEFRDKKPKPWYFEKNNTKPNFSFTLILKFFKNVRDEYKYKELDQTRFSLTWLLKKRISEIYNRYSLEVFNPFIKSPDLNVPFILFPLHKQPESSIDVLGDFVSNQLNLIENISRSLPIGFKLYVKEHSNAIGDRPMSFYKRLSNIPAVVLVSPYLDGFELMQKSKLIMTISGTMAYEAGLMGKGAITFAKMFFNDLPNINFCNDIHSLQSLIYQSLDYKYTSKDKEAILMFLAGLHANSYPGYFQDPVSTPIAVSDENIENIVNAIDKLARD